MWFLRLIRNVRSLFRINYCYSPLCSRSVSGVDVDPDLVHMEMQDTSGGTVTFHLLIYHFYIYS